MLRWTLLLTAALTCMACDESDNSTTPTLAEMQPEMQPETEAQPLCVEDDFGGTGWLGPAVQDGALTLDAGTTYRVSTTVLYLQDGDAPFQTFNQKLGPILGEMGTMDGLLAWHLGSSERCGAQRTITIWRDTDAMYRFVGSPAHTDAMGITADVARDASVTSWDSTGADVASDWESYRARLVDVERAY